MSGKHTPRPLIVIKTQAMAEPQFQIESDWINSDGEWRDKYVCFSGFFGSYGPHVFAAAPEMLEALKAVIAFGDAAPYWETEAARDLARAAIAKAEGQP